MPTYGALQSVLAIVIVAAGPWHVGSDNDLDLQGEMQPNVVDLPHQGHQHDGEALHC